MGLLIFGLSSLWASINTLWHMGLYTNGRYNPDSYAALGIARYYLLRADKLGPVIDLYTQGFVHPLIYTPILWLLELLHIPMDAQEGLAIGIVYSLSIGLIALLSFLILCQSCQDKAAFIITLFVCSSLLSRRDIDFVTPNAEILGSILILAATYLVRRRSCAEFGITGLSTVGLGILAFHLKYQLVPVYVAIIVLAKGKTVKTRLFSACLIITGSLLVDLLVYRLSGYGITSRLLSFANEYGLATRNTSNLSGIISKMMKSVITVYPLFLVAWIGLITRTFIQPSRLPSLINPLSLSIIALFAIALPGKNFDHYYLILLPVTVILLSQAFSSRRVITSLNECSEPLLIPDPRWKKIMVIASLYLLATWSALAGIRLIKNSHSGWNYVSLLTTEQRMHGIHLYGWSNVHTYGFYGSYPSNPSADESLALQKFGKGPHSYNEIMGDPMLRPKYVIDLAATNQAGLLNGAIKPFSELQKLATNHWSQAYRLAKKSPNGYLYIAGH